MKAVFAGSFDPITLGHLDIIQRGCALFEEVVVACGHNVAKRTLFTLDERLGLLRDTVAHLPGVQVAPFEGLLVDFCQRIGAQVILRGLRPMGDFEFEQRIALANRDMAPGIETVFLLSRPEHGFIASSLIKEIAAFGGPVDRYLPEPALRALRARLAAPSAAKG